MISKVNLSTGPVGITSEVRGALRKLPISHRSIEFKNLYNKTTALFCNAFRVRETYLLTGSGTLANEVMLQEIKNLNSRGLILSNGEFGERLIMQAYRNEMDFVTYRLEWGKTFSLDHIEDILIENSLTWILCCHCETSTGVVVDINKLSVLANFHHCLCFIDCMSTVGTMPFDLSGVAMATASSGKGLASIPGFAVVMSNIEPASKSSCPVYLDLHHYKSNGGIPFTIPSNLLSALYISTMQKMRDGQYELVGQYRKMFFNLLDDLSLIPFNNELSAVFTIMPPESMLPQLIRHFKKCRLAISYESEYLKKRGWCQLATFGYYSEEQLRQVSDTLCQIGETVNSGAIRNTTLNPENDTITN